MLDHARRPRNRRKLEGATAVGEGFNHLCGDCCTVYLSVAGGIIRDVSFEGEGCAIMLASASLMTLAVSGKTVVAGQGHRRAVLGVADDGHAIERPGRPDRRWLECGSFRAGCSVPRCRGKGFGWPCNKTDNRTILTTITWRRLRCVPGLFCGGAFPGRQVACRSPCILSASLVSE